MIDNDDADGFFLIAALADNPITFFIAIIIAVLISFYACQNTEECSKRHCENGQTPKLMEQSCLCVSEAKP